MRFKRSECSDISKWILSYWFVSIYVTIVKKKFQLEFLGKKGSNR